jgi:hypothetical protein
MREDRGPFWVRHPIVAFVVIPVVLLIAVSLGAWGLKVALSPVKGAGDVIIEQNKAGTRIGSQEELQERFHGITALCAQIPALRDRAVKNPGNFIAETDLMAAESAYLSRIAEYNAMTSKVTVEKWVGDLPRTLEAQKC